MLINPEWEEREYQEMQAAQTRTISICGHGLECKEHQETIRTEALPDHESIYGHREVSMPHKGSRRLVGVEKIGTVKVVDREEYYYKNCTRGRCYQRVHVYKVEGKVYYLDTTPTARINKSELPFCSWKCLSLWAAKQSRDTE